MVLPTLLLKEKIVSMADLRHNPGKLLKGFIRVVADRHGLKTTGFFMDKEAFVELLEALEYTDPKFWDELERSRKSGRVSSKEVERRLRLA